MKIFKTQSTDALAKRVTSLEHARLADMQGGRESITGIKQFAASHIHCSRCGTAYGSEQEYAARSTESTVPRIWTCFSCAKVSGTLTNAVDPNTGEQKPAAKRVAVKTVGSYCDSRGSDQPLIRSLTGKDGVLRYKDGAMILIYEGWLPCPGKAVDAYIEANPVLTIKWFRGNEPLFVVGFAEDIAAGSVEDQIRGRYELQKVMQDLRDIIWPGSADGNKPEASTQVVTCTQGHLEGQIIWDRQAETVVITGMPTREFWEALRDYAAPASQRLGLAITLWDSGDEPLFKATSDDWVRSSDEGRRFPANSVDHYLERCFLDLQNLVAGKPILDAFPASSPRFRTEPENWLWESDDIGLTYTGPVTPEIRDELLTVFETLNFNLSPEGFHVDWPQGANAEELNELRIAVVRAVHG